MCEYDLLAEKFRLHAEDLQREAFTMLEAIWLAHTINVIYLERDRIIPILDMMFDSLQISGVLEFWDKTLENNLETRYLPALQKISVSKNKTITVEDKEVVEKILRGMYE